MPVAPIGAMPASDRGGGGSDWVAAGHGRHALDPTLFSGGVAFRSRSAGPVNRALRDHQPRPGSARDVVDSAAVLERRRRRSEPS